jgi:hypothetical protein
MLVYLTQSTPQPQVLSGLRLPLQVAAKQHAQPTLRLWRHTRKGCAARIMEPKNGPAPGFKLLEADRSSISTSDNCFLNSAPLPGSHQLAVCSLPCSRPRPRASTRRCAPLPGRPRPWRRRRPPPPPAAPPAAAGYPRCRAAGLLRLAPAACCAAPAGTGHQVMGRYRNDRGNDKWMQVLGGLPICHPQHISQLIAYIRSAATQSKRLQSEAQRAALANNGACRTAHRLRWRQHGAGPHRLRPLRRHRQPHPDWRQRLCGWNYFLLLLLLLLLLLGRSP